MDDALPIASVVIAAVAVAIAIWQGRLSKRQLRLAEDTQGKTEAALQEIRDRTTETQRLTAEIKANIDERITRILDSRLETEREALAKARRSEEQGADMLKGIGGFIKQAITQAEAERAAGGKAPDGPPPQSPTS